MSKKVYSWVEFEQLAKDLGLKFNSNTKNIDEVRRKAQREKFCKCKICGGQRDYIQGTNCLVCNCMVVKDKKEIVKDKKGNIISEKMVQSFDPCGSVDLVSPNYQDYIKYLFE